jgi:hypothetical protein
MGHGVGWGIRPIIKSCTNSDCAKTYMECCYPLKLWLALGNGRWRTSGAMKSPDRSRGDADRGFPYRDGDKTH